MSAAQIEQVRRFNREVTRRIGVLEESYLNRGRPLSQARLIYEIGRQGAKVKDLRVRLGLDSGHLSRLLRALEKDGLVATTVDPADQRVRRASLTAAGIDEIRAYEQRSDDLARGLLRPLSEARRARLVAAMAEVERLLHAAAVEIVMESPSTADARACLAQYYRELNARFRDGFEIGRALPATDEQMSPPEGAFYVARLDGAPIGCGGVKPLGPGVGYIKRMWVAPSARGLGLGQRLLQAIEAGARDLGFHTLRLETNASLSEAQRLYRASGYREISAFNDEQYADHWFEKTGL